MRYPMTNIVVPDADVLMELFNSPGVSAKTLKLSEDVEAYLCRHDDEVFSDMMGSWMFGADKNARLGIQRIMTACAAYYQYPIPATFVDMSPETGALLAYMIQNLTAEVLTEEKLTTGLTVEECEQAAADHAAFLEFSKCLKTSADVLTVMFQCLKTGYPSFPVFQRLLEDKRQKNATDSISAGFGMMALLGQPKLSEEQLKILVTTFSFLHQIPIPNSYVISHRYAPLLAKIVTELPNARDDLPITPSVELV